MELLDQQRFKLINLQNDLLTPVPAMRIAWDLPKRHPLSPDSLPQFDEAMRSWHRPMVGILQATANPAQKLRKIEMLAVTTTLRARPSDFAPRHPALGARPSRLAETAHTGNATGIVAKRLTDAYRPKLARWHKIGLLHRSYC
jgi:hypothetical protein